MKAWERRTMRGWEWPPCHCPWQQFMCPVKIEDDEDTVDKWEAMLDLLNNMLDIPPLLPSKWTIVNLMMLMNRWWMMDDVWTMMPENKKIYSIIYRSYYTVYNACMMQYAIVSHDGSHDMIIIHCQHWYYHHWHCWCIFFHRRKTSFAISLSMLLWLQNIICSVRWGK